MEKRFLFMLIPLLDIFFLSCNSDLVYEKYIRIPNGIWDENNQIRFEVIVKDTITPYNLYINIRHKGSYSMSNMYLFITTTAPSGHSIKDTVQIVLADKTGKWLGRGLGDIFDIQRLYKKEVRFAQKGMYVFMYEQAMRTEKLPSVLDAGLRVEKVK